MTHLVLGFMLAASLAPDVTAEQVPAREQNPALQPSRSGEIRGTYVVGVADILKVIVFNEPDLTVSVRIDDDGSIAFPLLGRLSVAGRTVRDIEDTLRRLLLDGYVRNPQVTVEVEQFRSHTIFIVGEVRNGGKYPLQGEMTLLEVLALAGSVTAEASSEISVLRPKNKSVIGPASPDDAVEILRANLEDMKTGKMSANIPLQDGDTIYVPPAERFYVSGLIRNPGSFKYVRGITVQQAIAVAGGLTDRGSDRGVKLRRVTGEKQKLMDVKLTDIILPGDTIIIRQRRI
jgi:polysaccharide export outer membrane protein